MKAVINRRRYNTDTAVFVTSHTNGVTARDFHYSSEALYRTSRGNWFLAGEGGAFSHYSRSCGQNQWTGGSGIIPLSKEEALELLESWGEDEVIEEYFSAEIEDA